MAIKSHRNINMEHNEEMIKNKLWSIALEENHRDSETEFLNTFNRSKNDSPKLTSFREISDWTNQRQLNEQDAPTPQLGDSSKLEDSINRFSFLMTNKASKFQSQLLYTRKQKLELSPITMKFNVQSLSQNLKKQRQRNHFSQMANPPTFYELNYRPLGLLYEHQRKKDNPAPKHDPSFVLPEFNELKFPRTERVSSIMRLMKKNQELREYRRRVGNSNQWQSFRIN